MAEMTPDDVRARIHAGESVERADLRGIDLSNQRLHGARFDRSDLEGANLEASDLAECSFKRASLREAYLVGAQLSGANLENADLEGAQLERAVLVGANLSRANLEGADLTAADLTHARLGYAQLIHAKMGGANLTGAVLTHAELDEAYLGGVSGEGAQLTGASLVAANLEEANLRGADLGDAALRGANATGAHLIDASLVRTDLSSTNLSGANLSGADLRQAILRGALLAGTCLSGAKVAGLIGTGGAIEGVEVSWLDTSVGGDGSRRLENGEIPSLLSGIVEDPGQRAARRYFGCGDVLRDATLQFDAGARVEIDSLFQNCTINLGEGTEVVIGAAGVLADCQIVGAGDIRVHGKFFERESPGIVGARCLVVSSRGALVSSVAQSDQPTQFAFERGCQLRVKIVKSNATDSKPRDGARS